MPEELTPREERRAYTVFFNSVKAALAKGAIIFVSDLKPEDQQYVDLCMLEPSDGAYCD